jgi:uncharacterized protein YecE (DUF72 family)
MKTPHLFVGTAGWSYQDWIPNFYPRQQSKKFDWLEYYANYFNLVEVNASYYTYISPSVVENWLRKVDFREEFLFSVKLHQDFTHKRDYSKEQSRGVRYNLDLLKSAERLAGLLIQFPYSFDCNSANVDYVRRLIDEFEGYNKFIEVRHKSWENKKAKSVAICTIDQPQIGQSLKFNPIVGNGMSYIRFHGRNEEAWKQSLSRYGEKQSYEQQSARYEYLYSPGELHEVDNKIKEIYDKVKKVFLIMNNHPKGDAVVNAFEMLYLLKDREKVKIPQTIINAYPRLKKIAL